MLREMRPSELGIWLALWANDPWDERRADMRSALVAMQVSAGLMKRNDRQPWKLTDFMLFEPKKTEVETLRERFAGRIVKKKGVGRGAK